MRRSRTKKIIWLTLSFFLLLLIVFQPAAARAIDVGEPVWKVLKEQDFVRNNWKTVLNVVNGLIVVILIFVSFTQILRINVSTYGIKKALPSLIFAIVAANFSYLFCRLLIDLANVAISYLISSPTSINKLASGGFDWSTTIKALVVGQPIMAALYTLFMLAGTVMVYILAYLLLIRNWIIYFLVPLAPLAFMAMVLPQTKTIFSQWWSNFSKWVFMPVVSIFWLWLGSMWANLGIVKNVHTSNYTGTAEYMQLIFALACFYLAMTTPFKMGGALMGQWGKLGKNAWNNTAGRAKKKWVDPAIGEVKNNVLTWYNHQANKGALNAGQQEARRKKASEDLKKIEPRLKELEDRKKSGETLGEDEEKELQDLSQRRSEFQQTIDFKESTKDYLVGQTLGRIVRRGYRVKDRREDAKKAVEGSEDSAWREALGGKDIEVEEWDEKLGRLVTKKVPRFMSRKEQDKIAKRKDSIASDFGEKDWIMKHIDSQWKRDTAEGQVAVGRSLAYQWRMETAENVGKTAVNAAKAAFNLESTNKELRRMTSQINSLEERKRNTVAPTTPDEQAAQATAEQERQEKLNQLLKERQELLEKENEAQEKINASGEEYNQLKERIKAYEAEGKTLESEDAPAAARYKVLHDLNMEQAKIATDAIAAGKQKEEEISQVQATAPFTDTDQKELDRLTNERVLLKSTHDTFKSHPIYGDEWTNMFNEALRTREEAFVTEMAAKKAEGDSVSENALMAGKMQQLITAFRSSEDELGGINSELKKLENIESTRALSEAEAENQKRLKDRRDELSKSQQVVKKDWDDLRKQLVNTYYDAQKGRFIGPSAALQSVLTDKSGRLNLNTQVDQASSFVDNLPEYARWMTGDRMGKRYSQLFKEEAQSSAGKREAEESIDLLREWFNDTKPGGRGEMVRKYMNGDRLGIDPVFERKIEAEIANALSKASSEAYPLIITKLNSMYAEVGKTAEGGMARQSLGQEAGRILQGGAPDVLATAMEEYAKKQISGYEGGSEAEKRKIKEDLQAKLKGETVEDEQFQKEMGSLVADIYRARFGLSSKDDAEQAKYNEMVKVQFDEAGQPLVQFMETMAKDHGLFAQTAVDIVRRANEANRYNKDMQAFKQYGRSVQEIVDPRKKEAHKGLEDYINKVLKIKVG